jgi:predicted nucleotidyltransferase
MKYGLNEETLSNIQHVFSAFPEVEKAILYGSRAKGTYKPASDIDITLVGEKLDLQILNQIEWKLDDLLIPYTFDLSIFRQINNTDLIKHVERIGVVLYNK